MSPAWSVAEVGKLQASRGSEARRSPARRSVHPSAMNANTPPSMYPSHLGIPEEGAA